MADFGAQSGWQILSLGPGCHSTSRVIQARLQIKNFALAQNSIFKADLNVLKARISSRIRFFS